MLPLSPSPRPRPRSGLRARHGGVGTSGFQLAYGEDQQMEEGGEREAERGQR